MAQILSYPAGTRREGRGASPEAPAGELVAMRHIDLDTVIETIRFLRDVGRAHLLDSFNRGPVPAIESEPRTPVSRERRKRPTC